jgi:hypothetical protein
MSRSICNQHDGHSRAIEKLEVNNQFKPKVAAGMTGGFGASLLERQGSEDERLGRNAEPECYISDISYALDDQDITVTASKGQSQIIPDNLFGNNWAASRD